MFHWTIKKEDTGWFNLINREGGESDKLWKERSESEVTKKLMAYGLLFLFLFITMGCAGNGHAVFWDNQDAMFFPDGGDSSGLGSGSQGGA